MTISSQWWKCPFQLYDNTFVLKKIDRIFFSATGLSLTQVFLSKQHFQKKKKKHDSGRLWAAGQSCCGPSREGCPLITPYALRSSATHCKAEERQPSSAFTSRVVVVVGFFWFIIYTALSTACALKREDEVEKNRNDLTRVSGRKRLIHVRTGTGYNGPNIISIRFNSPGRNGIVSYACCVACVGLAVCAVQCTLKSLHRTALYYICPKSFVSYKGFSLYSKGFSSHYKLKSFATLQRILVCNTMEIHWNTKKIFVTYKQLLCITYAQCCMVLCKPLGCIANYIRSCQLT